MPRVGARIRLDVIIDLAVPLAAILTVLARTSPCFVCELHRDADIRFQIHRDLDFASRRTAADDAAYESATR